MRILMVSPYPPLRDGIANYAVQSVQALRRQGHDVTVLSPGPSAAHLHLDLAGFRGSLALARRAAGYDELVVQYHPAFFYDSGVSGRRTATDLALAAAFRRARRSVVVVHEIEYPEFEQDASRRRAATFLWRSVDELRFHSEAERSRFLALFPVDPARAVLVPHGEAFRRRTSVGREAARRSLGIGEDAFVFLAIGFIQRHKGFDRAVIAFRGLDEAAAELHVVGSTRVDEPDFLAYLDELEQLVAGTPGAALHVGYVSDERFDRWLVACDVVVLPYREIWSSGVLERAALYDRPVIATRVGGLADQAGSRSVTLVDDDADLRTAMRAAAGVGSFEEAVDEWPGTDLDDNVLWETVQAEVRRRASRRRGAGAPARTKDGTSAPVPDALGLRLSAPVRRLPPLVLPQPTSSRLGVTAVKRLVQRLTDWQVRPVAQHVDMLRTATARSLEAVEAELARRGGPEPVDRNEPVERLTSST